MALAGGLATAVLTLGQAVQARPHGFTRRCPFRPARKAAAGRPLSSTMTTATPASYSTAHRSACRFAPLRRQSRDLGPDAAAGGAGRCDLQERCRRAGPARDPLRRHDPVHPRPSRQARPGLGRRRRPPCIPAPSCRPHALLQRPRPGERARLARGHAAAGGVRRAGRPPRPPASWSTRRPSPPRRWRRWLINGSPGAGQGLQSGVHARPQGSGGARPGHSAGGHRAFGQ